jgi:V/A-type H+-transporting ATPase subunit I
LGFEQIIFPSKITGPPEKALYRANNISKDMQSEYEEFKDRIMNDLTGELSNIYAMTEQLKIEYERLIHLQRSQLKNDKYIIWAWFPKRQTKKFKKIVSKIDPSIKLDIIAKPGLESHEFPSSIRNNKYSRNYENLIHGFGTPGYNEWDPTKILSIFIPIFFGIMFGDVIDGFVVFLIGLYGLSLKPSKYSKNSMLAELQTYFDKGGTILVTMGITAMTFGFLFGSYRGLGGHHALEVGFPILWFSPEIAGGQFALLELALFIGFLVIGFALIMQFIGHWGHNKNEAIFLPGMFLLFYIGLIFLVFTFGPNPTLWLTVTDGKFDLKALQTIAHYQQEYMHHHYHIDFVSPIGELLHSLHAEDWGIPVFGIPGLNMSYPLALVIFPLILSSIYHFRHGMDGIGELLDYMITMISNTISFARIFAYNIVHGSLSLVFIQVLAGSPAHPTLFDFLPGMIVGGFIVIPLELLVSFLQSLRLCWVEFFGKLHYQGSGHKFLPFKEKRQHTLLSR